MRLIAVNLLQPFFFIYKMAALHALNSVRVDSVELAFYYVLDSMRLIARFADAINNKKFWKTIQN